MSRITIQLDDTPDGVAVETTIEGFDLNSPAQQMAGRINSYMAHIAQQKKAPTLLVPEQSRILLPS